MSKINFAIIGCGRISYKHIEGVVNNYEDARLVAVCDIISQKAINRKNEYKDIMKQRYDEDVYIKHFTDYNQMLDQMDIDVVLIATESGYHAKHAIDCMKKGKHIIVEKPMALSTKDADEMIKVAKEENVKLAIAHQNRFNPPIQELRNAVEKKRFGKLVNGTARILWNRNQNYYKQAPWRGTYAMDGGTLMNQCIHNIDLLQWMMGGEIESVYAQADTFLRDIEAEDFGAIMIRFKNGSIGVIEGSACIYPKNLEETLSIFGEKGTVVIGGLAVNKIETWKFEDGTKEEEERILKDDREDPDSVYGFGHIWLIEDFIEALKENREPLINGEAGKKAMSIILAAYKSSKTNEVIKFPVEDISTTNL